MFSAHMSAHNTCHSSSVRGFDTLPSVFFGHCIHLVHMYDRRQNIHTHEIKTCLLKDEESWAWWCTLLIIPLKRQRWAVLCEFKVSIVYKESPGQPGLHSETMHLEEGEREKGGRRGGMVKSKDNLIRTDEGVQ